MRNPAWPKRKIANPNNGNEEMRTTILTIASMVLMVGFSFAQQRGRGGFGDPEERVGRIMANDANGDGKLTKDEMDERMQPMFDRADKDEDGFVTSEELKSLFAESPPRGGFGGPGRGGFGGGPGRMLRSLPVMQALDADQNGELSGQEVENAVAALKALDKDQNGTITQDEMMPDFGAMMGGRGGPGGFGGPGRGGAETSGRPRRPDTDEMEEPESKEKDKN